MVRLEIARDATAVTCEQSLTVLRDALSAPVDDDEFGELGVGILDAHKGILDAPIGEFFSYIVEIARAFCLYAKVVRESFLVGEDEVVR